MPEDMDNVFSKKHAELENIIETTELTEKQKKIILTAVEFGYAAAFCERTADMNGSYNAAQRYERVYSDITDKLQ